MTAGVNEVSEGHVGDKVTHPAHAQLLQKGIIGKLDVVGLYNRCRRGQLAGNIMSPGDMVEFSHRKISRQTTAMDFWIYINDKNG